MSGLNQTQLRTVAQVSLAVLETVQEAGANGAPSGHIYAALMTQGATLSQFQSLMGTLTRPGHLVLHGDCYHPTATTSAMISKLQNFLSRTSAR